VCVFSLVRQNSTHYPPTPFWVGVVWLGEFGAYTHGEGIYYKNRSVVCPALPCFFLTGGEAELDALSAHAVSG
jgi:hypothetical protein